MNQVPKSPLGSFSLCFLRQLCYRHFSLDKLHFAEIVGISQTFRSVFICRRI